MYGDQKSTSSESKIREAATFDIVALECAVEAIYEKVVISTSQEFCYQVAQS